MQEMQRASATRTKEPEKIWDVVVIGGGPAGMMAAGRAAERGLKVLLLEKNPSLGKKLLITGGGRCNITNSKSPIRAMLAMYKEASESLYSPFSQFSVKETLRFFEAHGVHTKEEESGRIFPTSNKAQSVWDALFAYMQEGRVTVQTGADVANVTQNTKRELFTVTLRDGALRHARACVVATGGTSRPETGSTGDGFVWLKKMGHGIQKNNLALVPIALKDAWVRKCAGISFENIKLTAYLDGNKESVEKGKLLFTHVGISGPAALHISKKIGELIPWGNTVIELDLFPAKDAGAVKRQLQELLIADSNKKIKNVLAPMMPNALVPPVLRIAGIDPDMPCHSVSSESRTRLSLLLKAIPLHCKELLGANKAIISSGGVSLDEVNTKSMESRKIPRLYLVGDILDVDRPSGGYSLQLCWTTGYVAGSHC